MNKHTQPDLCSINGFLPEGFNKKKILSSFPISHESVDKQIRHLATDQCMGKKMWPNIERIRAWMLTAETATLMKWGGLGMVASELPENFNAVFGSQGHAMTIVTPLYTGSTGKKTASFDGEIYVGAERRQLKLSKIDTLKVPFFSTRVPTVYKVEVYLGQLNGVDYILFQNERFFSLTPHKNNPSTQDGCYVLNKYGINEVERFAFFSKVVCLFLEDLYQKNIKPCPLPNILIANDWHSGAVAGLCKYLPLAKSSAREMTPDASEFIRNIPIVHIAHHLGYQGWDYPNTARLLNALYGHHTQRIFKNSKAMKNANPRTQNTLIVSDCYNQASCNFHLADRVVTVSRHYMEEVSKELCFGYDFRDILKIRKNHRTFFGIVNGYEKRLISPNVEKIEQVNRYFGDFSFKVYNEDELSNKLNNKKECLKLLSKLACSESYRQEVIPLIDIYDFQDLTSLVSKADRVPFLCATSRLVGQKGYDLAAQAILKLAKTVRQTKYEFPVCVLGGAGDITQYRMLCHLKDELAEISPESARRLFVFRGYRDEFAYALQLASDFYLMPSRFEPCGLTQMEAMAKGALPIAMSTGGLVDTVHDGIDGFRTEVFFVDDHRVYGENLKARKLQNNVNAYADTLLKALRCFYETPDKLRAMTKNAMARDFGWTVADGSVYKYFNLLKNGNL